MTETTEAVDWEIARRFATKFAGLEPYRGSLYRSGLEDDFDRYTAQAEELVAESTGLRSQSGRARGRVTSREGWIDANLASFRRLLRPITDKLLERGDSVSARIGPAVAGAELGALLGWMSKRVLGQYDLLVLEDENPDEQDIVYYVAPNVLALERRFAFPSQEFRLWLALHEVTHRAQFTGVPWMRSHFLGLVQSTLNAVDTDPRQFLTAAQRLLEARKKGENLLDRGGLVALFASEEQLVVIDKVAGLMSFLEGHGDVTMARAGKGLIPSADRFARVMAYRRQSVTGMVKVFQRIVGIEAKLRQYIEGEQFIEAVESHGGPEVLDLAWAEPCNVPSIAEIRNPQLWIDRVAVRAA